MNSAALAPIVATGFAVAFLHAAIPTHWLPFVLVARARAWSPAKTLAVTAGAGLGHVALTSLLGLAIAWFGFHLNEAAGQAFPLIAGGILIVIGLYYLWRQSTGGGICHHPTAGGQEHHCDHGEHAPSHWDEELNDSRLVSRSTGDRAAIGGLFMMLTLSPCEGFLPIYLSGVRFGWKGFVLLSVILAVGAPGAMLFFTWLTLRGLDQIKLKHFERREAGLLGIAFCLLGVLVILLES